MDKEKQFDILISAQAQLDIPNLRDTQFDIYGYFYMTFREASRARAEFGFGKKAISKSGATGKVLYIMTTTADELDTFASFYMNIGYDSETIAAIEPAVVDNIKRKFYIVDDRTNMPSYDEWKNRQSKNNRQFHEALVKAGIVD